MFSAFCKLRNIFKAYKDILYFLEALWGVFHVLVCFTYSIFFLVYVYALIFQIMNQAIANFLNELFMVFRKLFMSPFVFL